MVKPNFLCILAGERVLKNRPKRKIDEVTDSQEQGIGETDGSKIKIQDTDENISDKGVVKLRSPSEIENYGWPDDDEFLADILAGTNSSTPFEDIDEDENAGLLIKNFSGEDDFG
jgi:hypothetical protein